MTTDFLYSAKKQFEYCKMLGEKTFSQLTDDQLFWQLNEESNSIATIVKHLSGNMLSRWTCLCSAINPLTENNLEKEIYIRNMGHTVVEAINRQLANYPYHVGQIVFIGKLLCNEKWTSLSIPKSNSNEYNADKFAKPKHKQHFTDEYLNDKK